MDIDMDINMDVDNNHDENEEIFKIETMEPGINAKTEEEMVKAIDAWCQAWKLRDYLLWSSRPRPEAGEDQKLKPSGKKLLLHQDA